MKMNAEEKYRLKYHIFFGIYGNTGRENLTGGAEFSAITSSFSYEKTRVVSLVQN
jgi:hypothetical protein